MDRVFGRETVGKLYSTLRRLRNFEVLLDVKGGQRWDSRGKCKLKS